MEWFWEVEVGASRREGDGSRFSGGSYEPVAD